MKTRLSLHLRPRVVYGRYLWHQREAGLFLALMFHFASPLGMFYTAGAAFRGVVAVSYTHLTLPTTPYV